MKQTIEIDFATESGSDHFTILKAWKGDEQLTVCSMLERASFGDASFGIAHAKIEVEVDHELPVKHYAIGIDPDTPKSMMGTYQPIIINSLNDIPNNEKNECLYDGFDTFMQRVITQAKEAGNGVICHFDKTCLDDKSLQEMSNNAKSINRILHQDKHDNHVRILLMSLFKRYQFVIDLEAKGKINEQHTNFILSKLNLSREMGLGLTKYYEQYNGALEKAATEAAEKKLERLREELERRTHTTSSASTYGVESLKTFGMFAGALAITGVTAAAARHLLQNFKP